MYSAYTLLCIHAIYAEMRFKAASVMVLKTSQLPVARAESIAPCTTAIKV